MDSLHIALIALVVALAGLLGYVLRLVRLLRMYGTFQCLVRVPQGHWKVGLMHLGSSSMHWYSRRSLNPRPFLSFPRESVEIQRHKPGKLPDTALVDLTINERAYQVLMKSEQFAALVSWVDSAPPAEEPLLF